MNRESYIFDPVSLNTLIEVLRDLGEIEIAEGLSDIRRPRDFHEDEELDGFIKIKREFCKIGILREVESRSNLGIPLRVFEVSKYWFLRPDIRKKLVKSYPALKDYVAFIEGFYGLERTVKVD